jgi:hypothetical protein
LLAAALGIHWSVFTHARGASGHGNSEAGAMAGAFWEVLSSELLDVLGKEDVDESQRAALREQWFAHVRASGPLPLLRLGRQPYGVLPATSLTRYQSDNPLEAVMVTRLRTLWQQWRQTSRLARNYRNVEDLEPLLRQEGVSCRYEVGRIQDASGTALFMIAERSIDPAVLSQDAPQFEGNDADEAQPPTPDFLTLLQDGQHLDDENFQGWNAAAAARPHSLLYLLLRSAALMTGQPGVSADAAQLFRTSLSQLISCSSVRLRVLMAETLDAAAYRIDGPESAWAGTDIWRISDPRRRRRRPAPCQAVPCRSSRRRITKASCKRLL